MDYINELMSDYFKALANPTRIQILRLLENGPRHVCDILPQLDSEQSSTSQHLAILRQIGILKSHRDGARVTYTVADLRVYEVLSVVENILKNHVKENQEKMMVRNI